jgi:hypothetical protein
MTFYVDFKLEEILIEIYLFVFCKSIQNCYERQLLLVSKYLLDIL